MNGFQLAGRPIKVGRPNSGTGSTSSFAPQTTAAAGTYSTYASAMAPVAGGGTTLVGNTKLFVGNIELAITSDMIKQIFGPFGTVISCELVADPENPQKVALNYSCTSCAACCIVRIQDRSAVQSIVLRTQLTLCAVFMHAHTTAPRLRLHTVHAREPGYPCNDSYEWV
jgi:RNA recognition motif. (a.k.a. RRM, RBD, or RNP domain)